MKKGSADRPLSSIYSPSDWPTFITGTLRKPLPPVNKKSTSARATCGLRNNVPIFIRKKAAPVRRGQSDREEVVPGQEDMSTQNQKHYGSKLLT